jgi:hypothetical protein
MSAAPAFVRRDAATVVRAFAKPGCGFWCRTRTCKSWDGSTYVTREFSYGCSFHRFDHADQDGYQGPVAILVDTNPRLRVDGGFPFVGIDDTTLSGWIRSDGYTLSEGGAQ